MCIKNILLYTKNVQCAHRGGGAARGRAGHGRRMGRGDGAAHGSSGREEEVVLRARKRSTERRRCSAMAAPGGAGRFRPETSARQFLEEGFLPVNMRDGDVIIWDR